MTLKKFTRLSAYSLVIGLCFVAQKGFSLPLWDTDSYQTNTSLTTTNLAGLLNPEGSAWAAVATTNGFPDMRIVTNTLTYPGLECAQSNAFLFGDTGGSTGYCERVAINPPINGTNVFVQTSGTIYYSLLMQIPSLGGNTSAGGFCCGFNTLTGPQVSVPTVFGARIYTYGNGSGYQLGIGKNPTSPAMATELPAVHTLSEVVFVVCSYTFLNGGTSNDVAAIWVDPDPSTFGAPNPPVPDATNINGGDLQSGGANQIESFMFRQGNVQIPAIYASNLRIGDCWACVTPPSPNPAPQAATLSIATSSTNLAVVSFPTNTACYKFLSSTNLRAASSNWSVSFATNTVIGTNFVITNTVPGTTVITTNVVGPVTNLTTNIYLDPTYYQVKTSSN